MKKMSRAQYIKLWEKESIRYIFFGGLTTILSILTYEMFFALGLKVDVSNVLSSIIAVLFAFFTNKLFVFGAKSANVKVVLKELTSFIIGRVGTIVFETFLLMFLVNFLGHDKTLMKIFTTVAVVILNYFISKFTVFKQK